MANELANILPKILARGLTVLREQATMARIVNSDYSSEARQKGDTIDVPVPTNIAVNAVTPGAAQVQAQDYNMGKVQIRLDRWFEAPFFLTDRDVVQIDQDAHFMPAAMNAAVKALTNQMNSDIHANYPGVYGFVGTAGTTPFASTVLAATDARKVLNRQLCPLDDRAMVLDFDAEAAALALPQFSDVERVGEQGPKIAGEIGSKFGFRVLTDNNVPTHTAGTVAALGNITVTSTTAPGVKSLPISGSSATGTIRVGDVFSIAGQGQVYAVTGGASSITSAATSQVITFEPALVATAAAAAVVTFRPTHVVNLALHPDAYAVAMRPLYEVTTGMSLGSEITTMTDPQTGMSMRLEVSRQHRQTKFALDILYGTNLVRPEYATRIAG